jgi:hypothetical protein
MQDKKTVINSPSFLFGQMIAANPSYSNYKQAEVTTPVALPRTMS